MEHVATRHGIARARSASQIVHDAALLREVAEAVLVSESYFFRDRAQLERAADRLTQWARQGRRPVAWSLGCARGEEPYGLAALLAERLGPAAAKVTLVGMDMHGASIAHARRGEFGEWSLRGVLPDARARHFQATRVGTFRVVPQLREAVRFHHATVAASLASIAPGSIDLMLFRNVGIYLTPEALTVALSGLTRALRPAGWLVMAPTDPLPTPSAHPRLRALGVGIYERAPADAKTAPHPAEGARDLATRQPPRRGPSERDERGVREALALADRGDIERARERLDAILRLCPDDRHARIARSWVLFAAQEAGGALRDLEELDTADPADAVPRYVRALCVASLGHDARALQELRELERSLVALPARAPLSDGYRREELLEAVRSDIVRRT